MYFLVMLATLLLAAFQVHGAAISTPPSDNSEDITTPTSVATDGKTATVGVQRFESSWVPQSDAKLLCARSSMGDMGGNFARTADCKDLASFARGRNGYWDTYDWGSGSIAKALVSDGTCNFRISVPSLPGGDGHIWIGNFDVGDAVGQAVAAYSHGGQVAVMGQLVCSDPNGETIVNWSISN